MDKKMFEWICFTMMLKLVGSQETLNIIPADTSLEQYVNCKQDFICYHPRETVSLQWVINGTNYDNTDRYTMSHTTESDLDESHYVLNITLTERFNDTTIQCIGMVNGRMAITREVTIILKDVPEEIYGLKMHVNEMHCISLSWNAPVTINEATCYEVQEEDLLANTSSEPYKIMSRTIKPSKCTDYKYIITPMNKAGSGRSSNISLESEVIMSSNYTLVAVNNYYDLRVSLTSVICSSTVLKRCINSNEETVYMNEFTLTSLSNSNFEYILHSNLSFGAKMHLSLQLNNSKYSHSHSINISTHSVESVRVNISTDGQLLLTPIYFQDRNTTKWSFVSLLLCKNMDCEEIDYENSTYVLRKNELLPIPFVSGYYQVFAFDVNNLGAISQSKTNIAYPAYNQEFNLTHDQPTTNGNMSNERSCSLHRTEDLICSQCVSDNPNVRDAQQQIALLPMNYSKWVNNGIRISEPTEMNVTQCLSIDTDEYYALILFVTQSETSRSHLYPIMRKSVSMIPYSYSAVSMSSTTPVESQKPFGPLTTGAVAGIMTSVESRSSTISVESTKPSGPQTTGLIVGISVPVAFVLLLIVTILIIVCIYCMTKKPANRGDKTNTNRTTNATFQETKFQDQDDRA